MQVTDTCTPFAAKRKGKKMKSIGFHLYQVAAFPRQEDEYCFFFLTLDVAKNKQTNLLHDMNT
jgi:hypothetical protein